MSAVHQLVHGLYPGDAIGNQAVFTREVLRELGHESEILAIDAGGPARPFDLQAVKPDDAIIWHHEPGSPLAAAALRHPGPKALQYHNITPGHFFAPWDPAFAAHLERGRDELKRLAPAFPVSAGDSLINASELRAAGYRDPLVVPVFVDPVRFAKADPEWMKALQDGRTNILFVGRVAPNKCQHHLLLAFQQYLAHDPSARLILAGSWPERHSYARFVRAEAERLGLHRRVLLTSQLGEAQLAACYRCAHLFWSMSEHEGFCVPLLEAMWFDVPVLAYRSTAVPETLGPSGLMFTEKRWPELAALAHLLVADVALRETVLRAQRRRRSDFLPEAIIPRLLALLQRLAVR